MLSRAAVKTHRGGWAIEFAARNHESRAKRVDFVIGVMFVERITFDYSLLNDFTGFTNAALTLSKPTVKNAIPIADSPAAANTHH